MSQTFEIKHRYTGSVLYSGGGETLREVVVAAVKSGAVLRYADLRYADLRYAVLQNANLRCAELQGAELQGADLRCAELQGADLRCAELQGAVLRGAKLIGDRPVLQLGPLGSRRDYLTAFLTDQGVRINTGCFSGALDKFCSAVDKKHRDSAHALEYSAAIAMIDLHAALWTPVAREKA